MNGKRIFIIPILCGRSRGDWCWKFNKIKKRKTELRIFQGNEDSSTPERIEGKGKERWKIFKYFKLQLDVSRGQQFLFIPNFSSSEVFSLRNVDSSTLNEMDILEEANSASLNIPR